MTKLMSRLIPSFVLIAACAGTVARANSAVAVINNSLGPILLVAGDSKGASAMISVEKELNEKKSNLKKYFNISLGSQYCLTNKPSDGDKGLNNNIIMLNLEEGAYVTVSAYARNHRDGPFHKLLGKFTARLDNGVPSVTDIDSDLANHVQVGQRVGTSGNSQKDDALVFIDHKKEIPILKPFGPE